MSLIFTVFCVYLLKYIILLYCGWISSGCLVFWKDFCMTDIGLASKHGLCCYILYSSNYWSHFDDQHYDHRPLTIQTQWPGKQIQIQTVFKNSNFKTPFMVITIPPLDHWLHHSRYLPMLPIVYNIPIWYLMWDPSNFCELSYSFY